jgi:hypothetical protein
MSSKVAMSNEGGKEKEVFKTDRLERVQIRYAENGTQKRFSFSRQIEQSECSGEVQVAAKWTRVGWGVIGGS